MLMPIWFAAIYMDLPESKVRWLIDTGELRPILRGETGRVLLSEREVRRWMRKNGYELSCEAEMELPDLQPPAPPPPPPAAWIDTVVPRPCQFFDRMDGETFGAVLARAYLRAGREPGKCPRNCPGWMADLDCLEEGQLCIYQKGARHE